MNGIYSTLAILCCAAISLSYALSVVRDNKYTFYFLAAPPGILMFVFAFFGGLS